MHAYEAWPASQDRSVPINYGNHNLNDLEAELVRQGDSCLDQLRPDASGREVFARMFHPSVSNFIMQDWIDHQEMLELLLCYAHIADLKYGMDKDGRNILAVMPSTMIMNSRFLRYIACARRNFPNREEFDRDIVKFVAGIEHKFPALFSGASAALQFEDELALQAKSDLPA
jgi:hypothetical protein